MCIKQSYPFELSDEEQGGSGLLMVTKDNRNKRKSRYNDIIYSKFVKYNGTTNGEHGLINGNIYKVVDQDREYYCIQVLDYFGYWYKRELFEHSNETQESTPIKYDYSIYKVINH